jgi:hypothetical protein
VVNFQSSLPFAGSLLEPFSPGSPMWMMREEYILFGSQLLAASDPTDMEG